ncbi:polysaccharide lyase family 7 protein, partial [Vibrio owensii]
VLEATLAVNAVTTTGDSSQVGRVIVGQIHANNDEPIRLYYRLLPGHTKGSLYFAHEPNEDASSDPEQFINLIGSSASNASEPEDGIALNELFFYRIKVQGNQLIVTIKRDDHEDVTETVDMTTSGYDVGGQYMYFKAGVYNQNNSGDPTDYVQATFYY